jgi:iron complex transport system substrate-binding protein
LFVKLDRRQALVLGTTLGISAIIAPRTSGSAQESTAEASPATTSNGVQPGGTWVFTDDRDRTVELPAMPQRIFADLQAGLSLFEYGIVPVGQIGYSGVYEMPAELADVPFLDLGTSGNEFDLEAIAHIDPDLSVGITWDVNSKADFGGFPEGDMPAFVEIAPTVCILGVIEPADVSAERFRELAGALGADLETAAIAEARAAFDTAADAVRQAIAAKPGLKVLAISPTEDAIWVGNPATASDLVLFANLGVEFIVPESPDAANSGLFQELSWEQVGNYQADLYMVDDRSYALTQEQLLAQPTFSLLPAAAAGQLTTWSVEYITSYRGLATLLTTLAEAIDAAEIVTG